MDRECKVCHEKYPVTTQYWYFVKYTKKDQTVSSYPAANCKKCARVKACERQRRELNKILKQRYDRNYTQEAVRNRRMWLASLKANIPCKDCNTCFPVVCMDWDHKDPKTKLFSLSNAVARKMARELILAEIAKCELVCSNCHRIRTAQQLNYHVKI